MTAPTTEPAVSPVIVLGMHRSGTSMLTGSLEAAGVLLGEVNNAAPHNRKGNKEHEGVRRLNDRILARYDADWKHPPFGKLPLTWTSEEFAEGLLQTSSVSGSGRIWGFKDPRTIWTLEGWLALFPKAHLIGVFRHPVAVRDSLLARPGALQIPEEDALGLWERTNRRLLSLKQNLGFPLLHFSETDLEGRFMAPLGAFTRSLGLDVAPTGFFDGELVHQKVGDEPCPASLVQLFTELESQAASSG